MLEKNIDRLLQSLHHILQVIHGWFSRFVFIIRVLIRFCSVVVVLTLTIRKWAIVVGDDSATTIGVVFGLLLRFNCRGYSSSGNSHGEAQSVTTNRHVNCLCATMLVGTG
jgi:hypothetical protein